jgi:signal transduction histidine kinase
VIRRLPVVTGVAGARPLGFSAAEWAPAAVLAVLGAAEPIVGGGPVLGPPAANSAAGVVAALLLVWRQRRPVTVLVCVGAVSMLPAVIWGASELASAALTIAVAVYACGRHGRRPWAYCAPVIGAGMVTLQLALDPLSSLASSWVWALNTLWIFALGAWVRQQATLADRAHAASEAHAAAAAAEDRVRTARDVHDILAHNLAVMLVQAEAADELLETDPVRAHRALRHVHQTGRGALGDVRGMLEALRGQASPGAAAHQRSGVEQIPGLVDTVRSSGLPVTLEMSADLPPVGYDTGMVAYRVVQESLTNVLRHAGTVPTDVTLAVYENKLRIRVHDHGEPLGGGDTVTKPASGQGLRGMRERVTGQGGSLVAGPGPTGGFTVTAELPLQNAAPGARS